MTIVFVVLKVFQDSGVSECIGVFSAEEKARVACARHADYMIGPVLLDAAFPYETMAEWPGAYYPGQVMSDGADR
jgi:hypothetical protein